MITLILALGLTTSQAQSDEWADGPQLPHPVTNNAVAAATTSRGHSVFSFLGLDTTKQWNGVVNRAFRWNVGDSVWTEVAPVVGPGRLAATAQSIGSTVYLFGGYTVAPDGGEKSLPNVDVYDPETDSWHSGAPMPLPVDDAVSGVWRDSLIYIISGWHDRDNVANAQIYDPATDTWRQATPIPGPPVFGHAGAIAGNTIVYVDGTRTRPTHPRFVIEQSAWRGDIDPDDPTEVAWQRIPDHPGPPLYRAAAAAAAGPVVIFAGGTDNPYNYNGLGYDGVPSEPRSAVFGFDVNSGSWVELPPLPQPSMDLRGIAVAGELLVLVGGMEHGQRVTSRVVSGRIDMLVPGR